MLELSDEDLLRELRNRLENYNKAINALKIVGKKLEDMNNRLLESESLKSNFISNIKNEINDPLSSVMIIAREMKNVCQPSADNNTSLYSIFYKELSILYLKLKNIFAAADIEAGNIALIISNIDIESLMEDILDILHPKIADRNIALNFSFSADGENRFFKGDPVKLELIISNLLSYAIELSFDGETINLILKKDIDKLEIIVELQKYKSNYEEIHKRFSKMMESSIFKHSRPGENIGFNVMKSMVEILQGSIVIKEETDRLFISIKIPEIEDLMGEDSLSGEGNEIFFDEGDKF